MRATGDGGETFRSRACILPLPKGEGRGEGEGGPTNQNGRTNSDARPKKDTQRLFSLPQGEGGVRGKEAQPTKTAEK